MTPYRQAKNDDLHNLVTIVMHHQAVDVHCAMKWIGELHDKLADKFLDAFKRVPSFGKNIFYRLLHRNLTICCISLSRKDCCRGKAD